MQLGFIAALLVAGIVAGVVFPGRLTGVFGAATLYVFLPALIFEGAWRLDSQTMRRMWGPIAMLAVPGVLCTAGIIAVCVHFGGGVPWTTSMLLGAILSATDPVAILAIFRRLRLPRALTTIVESEALLNDAAAVVVYRALLAATAAGSGAYAWHVGGMAGLGAVLGILIGAVVAIISAKVFWPTSRPLVYVVVTLAGAYWVYYFANRLDWSGIFAVITFGVLLRYLHREDMSEEYAQAVGSFWERLALIANGALFFLIGAALNFAALWPALPIALVTVAAVLLARFAIVYGLLHIATPRLHPAWMSIVRMAGIRGALSLALALAIPQGIPGRELVVNVTFVVVVITLLVGLLTLERRVKELPVDAG